MNYPKVSVIIPTYNCAKYLPEAIQSVLNQTYQDFEIIVVDDGSTDETKQILNPYIEKNLIRYVYQNNQGVGAARNKGIKEANSEYIAFLDSDDLWDPKMLERSLSLMQSYNYDWVACDNYRLEIDENGVLSNLEIYCNKEIPSNSKDIFLSLIKKNFIGGPSKVLARKKCFEIAGYFDETIRVVEDWELWLRFAKVGLKLGYIKEPLYYYRLRKNGIPRRNHHHGLICIMKVLNRYYTYTKQINPEYRIIFADTYWDLARSFIMKYSDFFYGSLAIYKSQKCKPSVMRFLKSLNNCMIGIQNLFQLR